MSTWKDFEQEARIVAEVTNNKSPEIVQLLQETVGIFADAFSVGKNPDTSDATIAKMSLLSHNFANLKCSIDLAIRGYYTQSQNLLRIVYENWIAFHYLSECPNKANLWLSHSKGKQPPGHAAMLKQLGSHFDPLKGQMREWYKKFCSFAHTSSFSVLPQISTNYIPKETSILIGTTYNDNAFRISAYVISQWTGIMLSTIGQWVPNGNPWHNEMKQIVVRIVEFIDQQNKAFGYNNI